jgi:Holliday junction resolvase RusA-like endonuclease
MITFTVPGIPVGKGRARFVRATGRAYTPAKTVSYEAELKFFAMQAMGNRPLFEGPLSVAVFATFPKPASWSKKKAAATRNHTSKPDLDNLFKCLDALNGVVWHDDAQVCRAYITKVYSDDGTAGLTVTVVTMGE